MLRAISLAVFLAAIWLLLSGHYTPLLLGFGLLSCVLAVAIALRMKIVDEEGHPIQLGWRLPAYGVWLFWEIVKSNFNVARRIISPSMPISPTVFTVESSQATDLGHVLYANSITLTPGTVTLRVDRNQLEIHALSRQAAQELAAGIMDRNVTWTEGKVPPGGQGK